MTVCKKLMLAVLFSISITSAHAIVPGGIVSHQAGAEGTEESMSVDIVIEHAPSIDSSYFWAQQFYTSTNVDHGGYFGLQTGGVINSQKVGKIAIFSIWNAVEAEAVGSAIAQTFGGEGVGYSIRLPYEWVEGETYRFALTKSEPLWWQLSINDLVLGSIKITEEVSLQKTFIGFTEYFRDIESCDALPEAKVVFKNLKYGLADVSVLSSTSYGNCAGSAVSNFSSSDAVHHINSTSDEEVMDTDNNGTDAKTNGGGGAFHPLFTLLILVSSVFLRHAQIWNGTRYG